MAGNDEDPVGSGRVWWVLVPALNAAVALAQLVRAAIGR